MFLRRKNKTKATVAYPAQAQASTHYAPLVIQPIESTSQPMQQTQQVQPIQVLQPTQPILQSVEAVPTTQSHDSFTKTQVQRAHESIARLQKERITEDELDDKGKRVLDELRQLLVDLHIFLKTKNVDTLLTSAFAHTSLLSGDVRKDRELGMHIIDWRNTYFSLDQDSNNALTQLYQFLYSLKESRTIFGLLAGGLRLLEQLLSEDSAKESMQDALFDEFVALMRALNHNPQWRALIGRSRETTAENRTKVPHDRPKIKISERPGYIELEQDLRHFLESLMGEQDSAHVGAFFTNMKAFVAEVGNNPAYREFVIDSEELLEQVAEDPDTLEDPAARMALKGMYKSAINMLRDLRHNPYLQAAKQDILYIGRAINSDMLTRNIAHDSAVLAKELLSNENDHLVDFKLLAQFRRILVPLVIETFREIRIPPIKGVTSNKKLKYHIHGIVLSSIELLPENVKIETTYKINSDPLHLSLHEHDTIVWVEVERIRAHVKGTAWNYEKLNFPPLKDEGLASVSLGGYGARVGLKLRISRQGAGNILQVLDSYCVIDRLDVALYECNHKIIYKFLHHYIVKRLKNAVEQSVADKLGQCVAVVDQRLMTVLSKSKRQKGALRHRAAQVKALMKKPQPSQRTKKDLKERVSSPSTKRRLLQMVSKARKSAEARAPPFYNSSRVPNPGHSRTTTTTTVETTVPSSPTEPALQTTTTTTSTTTSMLPGTVPVVAPVSFLSAPVTSPSSSASSSTQAFAKSATPFSSAPLASTSSHFAESKPFPDSTMATVTPSVAPLASNTATFQPSAAPLSNNTSTFQPSTAPLASSTTPVNVKPLVSTTTSSTEEGLATNTKFLPASAPLSSSSSSTSTPSSTTTTTTSTTSDEKVPPATGEVDAQGSYLVTL